MARDIKVEVGLNADEFVALKTIAEEEGLSHSALFRSLFKAKVREFVMTQLSDDEGVCASRQTGEKRPYVSTVNPLAGLPVSGSRRGK